MRIDWYANNCRIVQLHPAVKLLFGGGIMIMVMAISHWLYSLFAVLVVTATLKCLAGIPVKTFFRLLRPPLIFLAIGFLTIILTVGAPEHSEVIVLWACNPRAANTIILTDVGLQQGIHLIARALGAICALYFISFSTPLNDVLIQLRKLHVPMFLITLMFLVYRFIFIIFYAFQTLIDAQNLRMGYHGLKTGVRSLGSAMGALFSRIFTYSDRMEESLACRLFNGSLLTLEPIWRIKSREMVILAIILAIFILGGIWIKFVA
ncbi:MAG TPA: cobalt ECF transporter T component CbiQ [Clostridiaceae bacterium]|nr:cobalt ECF transporter T component CbiQ [Clostridiaceae bacterium]